MSVDEINKLKEEIEIRGNIEECFRKAALNWAKVANKCIKDLSYFQDDYFKDLTYEQIAELAKKSIRLACENRKLENALEKIKDLITPACEGAYNEEDFLSIKQIISDCEGENE